MRWIFKFALVLIFVGCATNSPTVSKNSIESIDESKVAGLWYELAFIDSSQNDFDEIRSNYLYKNKTLFITKELSKKNPPFTKTEHFSAKQFGKDGSPLFVGESFSGRYEIVKVDPFYQYALIFGKNKLWIISRKKSIPEVIKVVFLNHAKMHGYDNSKITWLNWN